MEYLFYVLAAGSIAAWLRSPGGGVSEFLKRLYDGCFSAYIIYEIAFFCVKDMRLSIAICGVGAFRGSGILDLAISFFRKKFAEERDKDDSN